MRIKFLGAAALIFLGACADTVEDIVQEVIEDEVEDEVEDLEADLGLSENLADIDEVDPIVVPDTDDIVVDVVAVSGSLGVEPQPAPSVSFSFFSGGAEISPKMLRLLLDAADGSGVSPSGGSR